MDGQGWAVGWTEISESTNSKNTCGADKKIFSRCFKKRNSELATELNYLKTKNRELFNLCNYYKAQAQTQLVPEPEPEPGPERITTPTPSESDWMELDTMPILPDGSTSDNMPLPVVSLSSDTMTILPVVFRVPSLYDVQKSCLFCGTNLTSVNRKIRNRHKSRCKRKQPLYYH